MLSVRRLLAFIPLGFLLVAAHPGTLRAQDNKYEGQQIKVIQFDPKVQPLESRELFRLLPLKSGEPLRMATVRASIDRLFATGRYANIQVDAQPYQGGVAITFITKNNWFIGHVGTEGNINSPPTPSQLTNATNFNLGQPYTADQLQQAEINQRNLLQMNGLYRSELHPLLEWDNAYQQVNITFEVDSGRRARFSMPVLTGDLKMDPDDILSALKFRRWLIHTWKPVTQTRVRQGLDGVRALYQKDKRLEAKVSLESMKYNPAENTATPMLRIDPGPRIKVSAVGAKIADRKIQRYVPIYEEHTVDRDLLMEGARNLRDYLQAQGYFEADVQFKQQQVINDQANIDYLISAGPRHNVVEIGITGNKYFTTDAIRERMYLRKTSFLQFPHGRYSENLLRRDEDSIKNLYQSNGFRDVKVSHRIVDNYKGKSSDLAIFIEIEEGPQYLINYLQIDGIERLSVPKIRTLLSSVEGQPFSEYNVAVDRDAILAQYFDNGFPNATFEWSWQPASKPYRVDLVYRISEGNQEFVRQVIYRGNRITKDKLINRTLELNPGDPLSPTKMTDTQRRLYDLNVFSRVDTAIQDPDGETASKYVLYDLEEARRYTMAIGFGAEFARIGGCQTCLDSPAGQTGFSPRVSFDITRHNLWGAAHSITLSTRASTLEQRALLTYLWPNFHGSDKLSLSFQGLYENSRDVRTFNYTRTDGSIQLADRASKSITFFYRYTYRFVTVSNLKITPLLVPLLSQPVRLGLISGAMIQDHRDDPIDPHRGYYNSVDMGMADKYFGSQRNYLTFLARNSTYHPIGRRLVLARNTEFGNILAFRYSGTAYDSIPLPERFFGGGSNSNRGFPDFQSGPRDPNTGFPLGGTALLFNQTEFRFPLYGENIGGVLFHDMGNTYTNLTSISFGVNQPSLQDFNYMVHAVGFGVRYRTPVGPLRLDLAYSINPPRFYGFNGTEQQLINAGVNPCATPGNCSIQNVSHFQFFFSIGQTF
jgi:outer membrane protein assembly complex protein YaeT